MLAQATPAVSGGSNSTWIVIAAVIVALLIIAAIVMSRRQRSQHLRSQFGSEYDRAVSKTGSRVRAESELAARAARHKKLNIRPLTPGARERYAEEWRGVQARFVDDPSRAIVDADKLVTTAMRDRGYPTENYQQQLEDLSVEHAGDLNHYRLAHATALRAGDGSVSTEDQREAMIHYRSLFDSLLGGEPATTATRR